MPIDKTYIFAIIGFLLICLIIYKIYYSKESFDLNSESITLYHADWCGHCQELMPKWKQFVAEVKAKNLPLHVRDVEVSNITKEPKEIRDKLEGFPTAVYKGQFYVGGPSILKLIESFIPIASSSVPLDGKEVYVLAYANWCGHCKVMMPDWLDFKRRIIDSGNTSIKVHEIEASELTPELNNKIKGFPTLLMKNDKAGELEAIAVGNTDIKKVIDNVEDFENNEVKETYTRYMLHYSKNCSYCDMLRPEWDTFKRVHAKNIIFEEIDVDLGEDVPKLIIHHNGTESIFVGYNDIVNILRA